MLCVSMPRSEKGLQMLLLKVSVQAPYSEPEVTGSIQNLQKAAVHAASFLKLANGLGGTCDPHSL